MYKPALPAELVTLLTPAVSAIQAEVTHGVMLVEAKRIDRIGKVVARRNGEKSYGPGHERIMAEAFGPALVAEIRGIAQSELRREPEPDCRCRHCEMREDADEPCDGGCDPCDDEDCAQCNPPCENLYACCGYCPGHGGGR